MCINKANDEGVYTKRCRRYFFNRVKLRSSCSVMKYHKEGPACGRIPYDATSSEADCEYPL